jgi:hypothetical protein
MVCHLPGVFFDPGFPFEWFWRSIGLTRRRQAAKKNKAQISHKSRTTGSMRKSTCRFVSQRGYGPYEKSLGSPSSDHKSSLALDCLVDSPEPRSDTQELA